MKILITGGAGFIGSHLVEHYHRRAEVVVLDNFSSGRLENLRGLRCKVITGSVLDREIIERCCEKVDYVFHLAALVSVAESMQKPQETADLNILGLLNLLQASAQASVKKLCFASSAAIYGNSADLVKVETALPDPRSPYAISKLTGEQFCEFYAREKGLPTASLRFFNVFGPRQNSASAYAAAVAIFLDRAMRNEPITLYGNGEQTRDFVFVKDISSALSFAAETPECVGVYNVGYNASVSIRAVAEQLIKKCGSRSILQFAAKRAGDLQHSQANAGRLQTAGWKAKYTFESGLEATINAAIKAHSRRSLQTRPPNHFSRKPNGASPSLTA